VLNTRQQKLIVELIRRPTIGSACRAAGIDVKQCYRWRQQPEFAAALAQARDEALADGLGEIKADVRPAGRTLRRCLKSSEDANRIRSAKAILDVAMKSVELLDLLKRVEALERRHGAGGDTQPGGGTGAGGADDGGGADAGGAAG
jgi:hypothetical protein